MMKKASDSSSKSDGANMADVLVVLFSSFPDVNHPFMMKKASDFSSKSDGANLADVLVVCLFSM